MKKTIRYSLSRAENWGDEKGQFSSICTVIGEWDTNPFQELKAEAFDEARRMLDVRLRSCRHGETKTSMCILSKELGERARKLRVE